MNPCATSFVPQKSSYSSPQVDYHQICIESNWVHKNTFENYVSETASLNPYPYHNMGVLGMHDLFVPIVISENYVCDYGLNPASNHFLPSSSMSTNGYPLNPSAICFDPENFSTVTDKESNELSNLDTTPQIFESCTPNLSFTDSLTERITQKG